MTRPPPITFDDMVEDFWLESKGDLVGLWEIELVLSDAGLPSATVNEQSKAMVRVLLAKGLLAGNSPYQPGGFTPWPDQTPEHVLSRIEEAWAVGDGYPNIPHSPWFGNPSNWTDFAQADA